MQGPRSTFSSGGGGGGGLERQTSKDESTGGGGEGVFGGMLPRNFFILTPLKCREMHSKLINEILKYKLSVLEKCCNVIDWDPTGFCVPNCFLGPPGPRTVRGHVGF